jgi:phage terminase large subunit-like protein
MVRSLGIALETDALNLAVFPNGSTIMFRSADPDSVGRGIESINAVFLDEFGFYDEQPRTLEAIAPSMTSVPNSKLFVVSTPNGKGDEFWRLLTTPLAEPELERKLEAIRTEAEPPFQIITGSPRLVLLNWREVYPGDRGFLERIKTELNLTEATVRQEYEMEFLSDSEDFIFPMALVRACTGGELESRPDPFGIYYAGVDVATSSQKNSDYTASVVLRKVEGGFAVAALYRKRSGTSQEHLAAITDQIEARRPIQTTIETNGPGKVWLESLAGLNLPTTLEGFNTSRPTKESLITRLLLAMERGELAIPDGPITQELLNFKRDPTGRLEAAGNSHDDTVMALGLALHSAGYAGELRKVS